MNIFTIKKSLAAATLALATIAAPASAAEEKGASAEAIGEVIKGMVKYGPKVYNAIVELQGHHQLYPWKQDEGGKVFVVLPLVNHDGSRMTDNIDKGQFLAAQRKATFRLVGVRSEDVGRVFWEVKSDVPGRGDGHRQVDDAHKTRSGDTIWLDQAAGKDYAYYLAGRWEDGLSEGDFWASNPNASVIIVLE